MTDRAWYESDWAQVGAKFTIHVADLLQNGFFRADVSPLRDYPIFDERYREYINDLIISHFMMWEIGYETEGLFYHALRAKMMEVMPRLNVKLRARDGLRYDPLVDHDYYITHDEAGTLDTTDKNREDKTSAQTETRGETEGKTAATDETRGTTEAKTSDTGVTASVSETKGSGQHTTTSGTEAKTSHEVMADTIHTHGVTDGTKDQVTRDSDTPQQSVSHLGYGIDDTWINRWLTHGQIINERHEDESTTDTTESKTTDYSHNVATSGTEDTSYNHTVQTGSTSDTDYTHNVREDMTDHVGYRHDITRGVTDRVDYTHGVTDDRVIDTDTTKTYTQHYSGRRTPGQDLAAKLAELAFDVETELLEALEPLFMGLYDC